MIQISDAKEVELGPDELTPVDLLSTLKPKVLDAFSRLTIEGAQHAVSNTANPLRLNFFSTSMRMLFEHMMATLAPVEEVVKSPWFVQDPEQKNGLPTRR